jgi:hypothetical protein
VSEDPIGLDGGINEYEYAGNDPVNNTDPSGLDCFLIRQHVRGDIVCSDVCVETPGRDYTVNICDNSGRSGPVPGRTIGPREGPPPAPDTPNIHLKALNCGIESAAAAGAAVMDFYVGKGVAIGYKMGVGVLGTAASMLDRMVVHTVNARYAYGAAGHATMAKIGRSAGAVAFSSELYGLTTAVSGGNYSWGGFAASFIPGVNTWNAIKTARDVCSP